MTRVRVGVCKTFSCGGAQLLISTVKKDQPDSDLIPQWKKSLDDDSAYLVHIPM